MRSLVLYLRVLDHLQDPQLTLLSSLPTIFAQRKWRFINSPDSILSWKSISQYCRRVRVGDLGSDLHSVKDQPVTLRELYSFKS